VTSFNVSSRSDLRLYESDNNATIIKLANQGDVFFDTCVTLLQRMIETVPKGVELSDVVEPLPVKPINATLEFDTEDNLIFTGYIRISTSGTSAALQSLTLPLSTRKISILALSPKPVSASLVQPPSSLSEPRYRTQKPSPHSLFLGKASPQKPSLYSQVLSSSLPSPLSQQLTTLLPL